MRVDELRDAYQELRAWSMQAALTQELLGPDAWLTRLDREQAELAAERVERLLAESMADEA